MSGKDMSSLVIRHVIVGSERNGRHSDISRTKHTGQSDDLPNVLLEQYRMFDTGTSRRLRRVAENTSSKQSRALTSATRHT